MLEKLKDSFVVEKLTEHFDISDYYDRIYRREELNDISDLLDYIEKTENIRLPLIPMLDWYRSYTNETFDCMDCEYDHTHKPYFIEKLKDWVDSLS